jgi:hypothetical protein
MHRVCASSGGLRSQATDLPKASICTEDEIWPRVDKSPAKWLERLAVNVKVATLLGSIPACGM